MADRRQIRKTFVQAFVQAFVLLAAFVAVAVVAGAASFSAVAVDEPAAAILGVEWQCSNMVLFTSCTRVRHLQPAAQRMGRDVHRVRPV